jgi:hypothetical protein
MVVWSYIKGLFKKDSPPVVHQEGSRMKLNQGDVPEFVENDNIVLSVYKDQSGNMYVGVNDREEPDKKIVITAEAIFKMADIVNEVFESKKTTTPTRDTLN